MWEAEVQDVLQHMLIARAVAKHAAGHAELGSRVTKAIPDRKLTRKKMSILVVQLRQLCCTNKA